LYNGTEQVDEDDTEETSHQGSGDFYRNGGLEVVIDRVRCRLYKSGSAEEGA
jgi:hypothetical protein